MYFSKIILDMAQKKYKEVTYIQMDISYYGKYFSKVKYYPAKVSGVSSHSLRDEDGFWFGLDLDGVIPINVHLFFFDRKWNTNCEHCERDADGGWSHVFDSSILCKNIRIKYTY